MSKHKEFILTPIFSLLKDVILANSGIGAGIETFSLSEYIFQSVFLKMTGFQEQKMKCICWEMATNDYEYRRNLLGDDDRLGECSTYESKNKIYKRLIFLIEKNNPNFEPKEVLDTTSIRNSITDEVKHIFKNTNLSIWNQKSFFFFSQNIKEMVKPNNFIQNKKSFFESNLQNYYKNLYSHRNRCAHNTLSYQENLPTLKTLFDSKYPNNNYFVWFSLLILIDQIFIDLYNEYLTSLEDTI
ncbi:hypothetical protein [Tenacibaculum ovolyticum]|uniref:hypothetical protein n=1 Tax=Tenacibaculum ovolyticum TaxID=104270 RepID=UPI0007EC6A61|nr:hypothetical protein [Tenacibaculum ovolyticum]